MRHPLPGQYLNRFLGSVADCLDAYTAALFVFEEKTRQLRLRAFHSLSEEVMPGAVIGEGQGFVSWVMRNQRPVQVPRFRRDSRTLGFYQEDAGLKSFLAVPLPEKTGVLSVDSRSRFAFAVKHERILETMAAAAYELLNAEKTAGRLEFYSSVTEWQMRGHENSGQAVLELLEILGLDTAIVARHFGDRSFIVVEDVLDRAGKGIDCRRLRGEKVGLNEGMAGWVAKHESSILLERHQEGSKRGFLLRPGEPFSFGTVVAGVFCPSIGDGLGVDYCFIFSGEADTASWPPDVLKILEFFLKSFVPWH